MAVGKKSKRTYLNRRKPVLTDEQKRNSDIFRLRGYYSNAKTLPFNKAELVKILDCIDDALVRLGAESQSEYMTKKALV
jgi:hypothetical protein